MSLIILKAILVALAIGTSVYLVVYFLFNLCHPLTVVLVWIASIYLAHIGFFSLWAVINFFIPMLILSAIGTYFLGASARVGSMLKYCSAALIFYPLIMLSMQMGILLSYSWIENASAEQGAFVIVLLLSPVLTSILLWAWQKKNRSLPNDL